MRKIETTYGSIMTMMIDRAIVTTTGVVLPIAKGMKTFAF